MKLKKIILKQFIGPTKYLQIDKFVGHFMSQDQDGTSGSAPGHTPPSLVEAILSFIK